MEIGSEAANSKEIDELVVLTDSQATLERLRKPSVPKLGQYLLLRINELLNELPPYIKVTFCWCPGHVGVTGNELADEKADKAGDSKHMDDTIRASVTPLKEELHVKSRVWKGSPKEVFPAGSVPPTTIRPC